MEVPSVMWPRTHSTLRTNHLFSSSWTRVVSVGTLLETADKHIRVLGTREEVHQVHHAIIVDVAGLEDV